MIRKIFCCFVVILLVISGFVGIKYIHKNENKPSMYLAMGDKFLTADDSYGDIVFEKLKGQKVKSYSDIVKRSSLDSESLLRFIEIKATIINDKNHQNISDLIKKAKYISLQVGEVDLYNNVRFNKLEEKFYYNSDVVNRLLANLQENIYNIVNAIKEINNDVKIYVLGYCFPYPSINEKTKEEGLELYGQLNSVIRLGSYDSGATFIDISDLSNVSYFQTTEDSMINRAGQEQIANLIVDKVLNKN